MVKKGGLSPYTPYKQPPPAIPPVSCPENAHFVDRCLKPLHHQKSVPSSGKLLLAPALLPAMISSSSESPPHRVSSPPPRFQPDRRPRPCEWPRWHRRFHPGRAAARTSSTPQLLWRSCKNYASVEPDADRLAGSRFLPKGRRRPVEAGWDTGVRCWLPNCKENVSPIGDDTSLPASRVGTVASDANRRDGRFHAREPVLSGSKATLRARFPVRGLLARIPEHSPSAISLSNLPQQSPTAFSHSILPEHQNTEHTRTQRTRRETLDKRCHSAAS